MEPGGLWDADKIQVRVLALHDERVIADTGLAYSGQPNIFKGTFHIGKVEKDYEVLSIQVTASQKDAVNFGAHRLNVKLLP